MQNSKLDSQSGGSNRVRGNSDQSKGTSVSDTITDLPYEKPPKAPKDLPSPRHRPGEPILYDPPASGVETFPASFPEWNCEQHLP